MGRFGSSGKSTVEKVATVLLVLGVLAFAIWAARRFYLEGRDGAGPSGLWWIVTGIAVFLLVGMVVQAIGGLRNWSDNTIGVISVVLSLVGLVAAVAWVGGQKDPLVETLGPVCRGEPVPNAGDPTGPGARQIVVLGNDGERVDWTDDEADWRATRAEDAALVVCVDRHDDLVETCGYTGGPSVSRYQEVIRARVVSARTGELADSFQLTGTAPHACRSSELQSVTRIDGEAVPFADLSARLATYAGSAAGATTTSVTALAATTTPRPATTTGSVLHRDLVSAVEEGLVQVEFRALGGASGDIVELLIESLTDADLEITVPPGLMLHNPAAGEQDLVVTGLEGLMTGPNTYEPADEISLDDDSLLEYLLEAYCAEAHEANPSESGALTMGAVAGADLVAVLQAASAQGVVGEVMLVQAVVWVVTDDVTAGDLEDVGYGLDAEEISRARAVITAAGLDPGDYRLFTG